MLICVLRLCKSPTTDGWGCMWVKLETTDIIQANNMTNNTFASSVLAEVWKCSLKWDIF